MSNKQYMVYMTKIMLDCCRCPLHLYTLVPHEHKAGRINKYNKYLSTYCSFHNVVINYTHPMHSVSTNSSYSNVNYKSQIEGTKVFQIQIIWHWTDSIIKVYYRMFCFHIKSVLSLRFKELPSRTTSILH